MTFEFGLGVYPGVNGVRVTQPLVRLAVGGNSALYESAAAMAPAQTFEDFELGLLPWVDGDRHLLRLGAGVRNAAESEPGGRVLRSRVGEHLPQR